jgi:hypothetical protein
MAAMGADALSRPVHCLWESNVLGGTLHRVTWGCKVLLKCIVKARGNSAERPDEIAMQQIGRSFLDSKTNGFFSENRVESSILKTKGSK